jgi:two-component system sensor histidine kinase/response regulator
MSGGRPAVLDRLREVLHRSVPEHLAAIRTTLEQRDFTRLRAAAHMLAGTVSGFSTIAGGIASALEDAAIAEDLDTCTTLAARLDTTCAALLEETRGLTLDALRP